MKRPRRPREHAEIDMAPLIDMVFLLLIFFMCTATMSQIDLTPDVALPVAARAQVPEDMRDRGTINILPDKRFMIAGQYMTEKEMLKELRRKARQNPTIKIYLRADRTVPFCSVKTVLRLCAQAGIVDIIFASFQTPEM